MTKQQFKQALFNKTRCHLQHTGWCCNSCWFNLDLPSTAPDAQSLWETILVYRGDYKMGEMIKQTKDEYNYNFKWLENWLKVA